MTPPDFALTEDVARDTDLDTLSGPILLSFDPNVQVSTPVPPRRKRRSTEVRNSLRLFGLLTVLGAVNVYVFFFNRGTAPREVLKPSSLVRGADGQSRLLKEAGDQAAQAMPIPAATVSADKSASVNAQAAQVTQARKAKVPVVVAPASATNGSPSKSSALSTATPPAATGPKGLPGGNPGESVGVGQVSQSQEQPSPLPQGQVVQNQASQSQDPAQEKKIGPSDTLGQLLGREGFGADSARVASALSRLFDPRLIRGGQSYSVRLSEAGEPEAFEFRPNAVSRFIVARGSAGSWVATRVDQAVESRIVSASGSIDSSLYESIQQAGEGSALAGLLVDLLAWDVNFYTDTHPGDYWKVTVEKQFLGEQFYRYGHILAAEYGGKVGTFRAFYWKPGSGDMPGHYFDEKGQAISKTLLKTPLRYVRVSSKFDRHRFHPILHREKAHLGIDYAAPVGTPVWASAGGRVSECAMKRGSGNTVVISHANGLSTRYYHLSRFARGLKAGMTVHQKEVIGFVGTTGLSTGPHLHFSVTKNGAFVDPNKVQVNRDAPVPDRSAFLAAIRQRLSALRAMTPTTLARN